MNLYQMNLYQMNLCQMNLYSNRVNRFNANYYHLREESNAFLLASCRAVVFIEIFNFEKIELFTVNFVWRAIGLTKKALRFYSR